MSSSHQSTTMSLEQAKNNYRKMVTHFLTYFTISQIVSGKASRSMKVSLYSDRVDIDI